jgi:hypothetical protein
VVHLCYNPRSAEEYVHEMQQALFS